MSAEAKRMTRCDRCKQQYVETEPAYIANMWWNECSACLTKREAQEKEAREQARLAPIPKRFRWATFADGPLLAARTSEKLVRQAIDARFSPRVTLVGPSGAGKTSLACAMVRDRLDAGEDVAVMLAWRLGTARALHPLGEGEPMDVKRATSAKLLLLDDMGSERNIATNAVPDVIFERDAESRPTWVTTWMSPEKMAERYGDGIARRVFEGAAVIDCGKAIEGGKK